MHLFKLQNNDYNVTSHFWTWPEAVHPLEGDVYMWCDWLLIHYDWENLETVRLFIHGKIS